MKRTVTIILSIATVVGLAFLGSQALRGQQASPAAGYETVTVHRGELVATGNATGCIAPRNRAVLTFSAPGRITEINVSVGDQVRSGQVLAAIDARDLQQAVAQAQVDQNAASLEQARLRLEGAVLRAPFAGVVAGVTGRAGELASMNAAVITLVDLGQYHIDVDIDEASIGQIEPGQKAEIALDAFPEKGLTGQVTHIDPVGTLSQGVVNYAVTVQLDPSDVPIKADMTASANIITARKANVLLVPNRAVRRDGQGRFVEVIADERVIRQDVETGLSNEAVTEITEGLQEGVRVVVSAPRQSPFAPKPFGGR